MAEIKNIINIINNKFVNTIEKNSNDVITDLILSDYLLKSKQGNIIDETEKKINEEIDNEKMVENLIKILNTNTYSDPGIDDINNQIEKTESFKNKIFSVVYNLLINKGDYDHEELINTYNPTNNPLSAIDIDNYLENKQIDENKVLTELILKLSQ